MDSNHPRRLYESRVLPTELASRFHINLAGRAGFEPAHGPAKRDAFPAWLPAKNLRKNQKAPTFVGAFGELESD